MRVVVAGGHGQIAMHLERLLSQRGDEAVGMVRNPDHEADLQQAGAQAAVLDLEQASVEDVVGVIDGADAVVFAAGAGPGSGAGRKRTMDLGGALKLIEAAKETGVRRYAMVSAMGAADPPASGGEVFGEYLRAKAAADEALRGSGLEYTIVRPGGLTDAPGTGRVRIAKRLPRGEVPRADVAAVLAAVLVAPNAIGREFDLLTGETPVEEAVAAL